MLSAQLDFSCQLIATAEQWDIVKRNADVEDKKTQLETAFLNFQLAHWRCKKRMHMMNQIHYHAHITYLRWSVMEPFYSAKYVKYYGYSI